MFHPSVIIASASPDAISAIASNPSDHSGVIILVVVCALIISFLVGHAHD